ncbi:MAG: hypothetical protein AB7P76_13395 [Candidatus Melainabacteria bacterium]
MTLLPGVYSHELEPRDPLVNDQALVRGQDVVLAPSLRSPLDPPYRIHPGTVIVPAQGARRFVAATDPAGQRNEPASVSALQPADAAWAVATVTVSRAPGLGVPVVLDPTTATTADVVGRLNQDRDFSANFLADEDAQGHVRVRTRAAGADQHLRVECSLPGAFGPDGQAGHGTDADYRVTIHRAVEVQTTSGKPVEALVPTLLAGHFDPRRLLHLTPEARVVLARRGSIFKE